MTGRRTHLVPCLVVGQTTDESNDPNGPFDATRTLIGLTDEPGSGEAHDHTGDHPTPTNRTSTGQIERDGPLPFRLGVLGGTFDPPHVGHVVVAVGVKHALDLDAVWLVVANSPWQKVGSREITPAADRLALVEAAVRDVPGLEASGIEIERGGASYTADTVDELRGRRPETALHLIVGADAAAGLDTWERADDVRRDAVMVLVERPGIPVDALPAGWSFERVRIPRLDVSSTDLRRRVRDAEPIDGLVPPAVVSVIRERGLYRGSSV